MNKYFCLSRRRLHSEGKIVCRNFSFSKVLSQQQSTEEYIQQSIVPTDHFQKSLPRLPIPKLPNTCTRYLNALRPLLSPEGHEQTRKIVEQFKNKEGIDLHEELVLRNKKLKHTSYISGPWFDMYLRDRSPIVLNYNPFLVFNDDPKPDQMDQVVRATNFIVSALRFKRSLKENLLEPDMYHLNPEKSDTVSFRKFASKLPKSLSWYGAYWYKVFPLDMSQYGNLFNSTRIPRIGKDELYVNEAAKHIVVIRNGEFYHFDILDENGNMVKPEVLLANIKYISNMKSPPNPFPVGYLTAENRDTWALIREKLVHNGNASQLQAIDSAMFVLVLENENADDFSDLGKMFLYGNGANRWFDKSFSLIVNKSGRSAVNFEHSWGDGVAVLSFFNKVYEDTAKKPRIHKNTQPANVDSSKLVKKLDWSLNNELQVSIEDAKKKYNKSTSLLDMAYIKYPDLNKTYLAAKNLSPDSFMQLAFQLAYSKLKKATVATYESCSTAAFKHGRTETIRSATMETKSTCAVIEEGSSTNDQLVEAMRNCSTIHMQLIKEAALGQGFDRHLMALRTIANEHSKHPELFEDPSYKLINHNILSTSSLVSPALMFGGFAPVVPDGFGIGYAVTNESLGSVVTSYLSKMKALDFCDALQSSIKQMHNILEKTV